jgi:hypothetical protein
VSNYETETTISKRDTSSGDLKEIYMFIWDLFSHLARNIKTRSIQEQGKLPDQKWILALVHLGAIPYPDACVETAAGYRRQGFMTYNLKIFPMAGKLFMIILVILYQTISSYATHDT